MNNIFVAKPINESLVEAKSLPPITPLYAPWWNEGETCFFFGSSGIGKTLYSMQIAYEISKTKKLLYFDFEMSTRQLLQRYQKDGEPIDFHENFIRLEVEKDIYAKPEKIVDAVIKEIENQQAEVVIIDNITWLLENTQDADASIPFMKKIAEIKNRLGVSVLILAHTPKRRPSTSMAKGGSLSTFDNPLELADMAGSAALTNFIDSCFAIGKSRIENSIRYLKQVKFRSGEIKHGEENVMVCRIDKTEEGLLGLVHEGYSSELEHIIRVGGEMSRDQKIVSLRRAGLSLRKIGDEVDLTHTQVKRILDDLNGGSTGTCSS